MKKTILVLASVVFCIALQAQFSYGPKVGLNLANLSGDDVDNNSMLMSFNAGVFGNYGINDMFSVQAEVNYEGKGCKIETTNASNETEDVNLAFGYITIPVLAKATFGDNIKFYGNVGPYIGLLMGATFDGESEYEMPTGFNPVTGQITYETVKVKDSYKGTDFGVIIGAGAYFPMGDKMKLMVDARYGLGLGSIAEEPDQGDAADVKTGTIGISAGLVFGLE